MGIQNEIIKYKPISPSTYLLALIVLNYITTLSIKPKTNIGNLIFMETFNLQYHNSLKFVE